MMITMAHLIKESNLDVLATRYRVAGQVYYSPRENARIAFARWVYLRYGSTRIGRGAERFMWSAFRDGWNRSKVA